MVVNQRGVGLRPLESHLEDGRCFRSDTAKPSMGTDRGNSSRNHPRQSQKLEKTCSLAKCNSETNATGSELCTNGASPSSSGDKPSQTWDFEGSRPCLHDYWSKHHETVSLTKSVSTCPCSDSNKRVCIDPCSSCASCSTSESRLEADSSLIPGLGDDIAPLCLAWLSPLTYCSYYGVSKKFRALLKSGELQRIRRQLGISNQWVFLLKSGQSVWRVFDPKDGGRWRPLPPTPTDECFAICDKESLTAGTQLLVIGREIQGLVVWRYDLLSDSWFRGPQMNTARCLYASASHGEYGYVAGGVDSSLQVIDSAERYNSLTGSWESLPSMSKKRRLCSGFYMDGKFWVIGGADEKGEALTCGEKYDPETRRWSRIEHMFPHTGDSSQKAAPPLVAVVRNQLYSLDISANQLKLYCKKTNTWKLLGDVPVRADFSNGWGLAFKALDGQLVLIGGHSPPGTRDGDAIYAWNPNPHGPPDWRFLAALMQHGTFVFNCAVMSA